MGSDAVTVVVNLSKPRLFNRFGNFNSDTAWRPDWNEVALHHDGSTSVVVFVEQHSLRVLAVHNAKRWRKYPVSHVAEKCTDRSVGLHWHHITRLRKSDNGSCFRQYHEDYQDPINRSLLYCWVHRGYN